MNFKLALMPHGGRRSRVLEAVNGVEALGDRYRRSVSKQAPFANFAAHARRGLAGANYLGRRVASRRNVTRRLLSLRVPFQVFNNRRLWACGRRRRRWATQPRSGALSTVAAGAPQAHRPHVHGLPGAQRPAPVGREVFPLLFHTSAGMTADLRKQPRTMSFARSARQVFTRRCSVRSCALLA